MGPRQPVQREPERAPGGLSCWRRAESEARCTLRTASSGAPSWRKEVPLGAVPFLHRFGSSLYSHLHYYVLVFAGVFSEDGHREVQFPEASRLQPHAGGQLQPTVPL